MGEVKGLRIEELEERIAPARAVLMDLPSFWTLQESAACKLNTALNDGDTSNDKLALKFSKKLDKITEKLTKFESQGKLTSHKITMLGHKLTHLAGKIDAKLAIDCPPPDDGGDLGTEPKPSDGVVNAGGTAGDTLTAGDSLAVG